MRLLLASPFLPPDFDGWLTKRTTIQQIFKEVDDLDWAEEFAIVRLNGITVPRAWWPHITVKPEAEGLLWICPVPQKGSLLPILASVALVALTAGIGAFGVPFLGAAFAAGSFGASAVAAGVGIAGQLAIRALTAPPSVSKGEGAAQRDVSQAGISQNQITLLEPLPTVHGKMLVSPPVLAPPYTTWEDGELKVHAIVGVQGRCLLENLLVNGNAIALVEGLVYETREGGPGDAPLTLAQLTCIQKTDQVALSQHQTELLTAANDLLKDQVTPANSLPVYHPFSTNGAANEIWIRLAFPGGIVFTPNGASGVVAFRIELRKKGDVAWRNCPTLYVWDDKAGRGLLRTEIKLKIARPANGPLWGAARLEYPVYAARDIQGNGKAWEYVADSYFNKGANPASAIPVMTAATTSGVTISDTLNAGAGNAGWKAADSDSLNTFWQFPAANLPQSITVDFGAGNTKKIKSFKVGGRLANNTFIVKGGFLSGSTNGTDWVLLSTIADAVILTRRDIFGFVEFPADYRYYKFTVTANNGGNTVTLSAWELYQSDVYTSNIADGFASPAHYVSANENGVDIFLDPEDWDVAEYEVRIKRSWAFDEPNLLVVTDPTLGDAYNSSENITYMFSYTGTAGAYTIYQGQRGFRSDAVVEVFSTVSYDVPVDTTGIAGIALEGRNLVIDSISGEFTSYAAIYSAGVWTDTEVPTSNPAALYRQLLLGHAHPNPPPGEIINEDELAAWYTRCASAGHECNFLQQGRSVAEVKSVIASTGYASPRESNMLSVVEDYDRSGEAISQMLSPLNSKLLGVNIPLPELEHAIYAEYFDAADDWKIRRDIFYRTGFDANTATLFSTVTYDGFTAAAKVATRAAFDLKQVVLRARTVRLEIGIEGYSLYRGKLVGHNDDVLNTTQAQGLIRSITESGGNVVSITVDNIIPFSVNQDELAAFVEGLDLANATGVAIRKSDGASVVKTLTNISDGSVCTFTTPFALAGSGLEEGLMCVFGRAGQTHDRMIVMAVEPQGLETRIVTLAAAGDAALFA